MGKWTPDYVDDVLQHKISSLVTGAIRRAAVEKDCTPITYEGFVNELDSGDSFTTTLVDILVKEIADRRTRPYYGDRRLLADRTLRSLRSLAATRPYISPHHPARQMARRSIVQDYPGAPHIDIDLMDDDDDDEVAAFYNPPPPGGLEGTRMNTEMYDALNPWPHNPPSSVAVPRMISDSPSPVTDEWPTIRPWSTTTGPPSSAPTTLSRQASIRRAQRSRVVDFNDFTHRRRTTNRDARGESAPGADLREGAAPPTVASAGPSTSSWSAGGAVRRFFPFPPRSSFVPAGNLARRTTSPAAAATLFEYSPESPSQPFSAQYYEVVGSAQPIRSSSADAGPTAGQWGGPTNDTPDDILTRAPRLRRGGVRPPETIVRHRSPVFVVSASPPPHLTRGEGEQGLTPTVPSEPNFSVEHIPRTMIRAREAANSETMSSAPPPASTPAPETAAPSGISAIDTILLAVEDLVSYPTPGSTENENLS